MKALILAGGLGTRLGKYSKEIPKSMVDFLGKPLLERQIENFREVGINDIVLIRKHMAEKINFEGVRYVDETDYTTHMVVGLFEARKEFDDDIIISYGDLVLEKKVLEAAINSKADVGVVVDINWKDYWNARLGDWRLDSESLVIGEDNRILSLGKESPKEDEMDGRYLGVIKISKGTLPKIEDVYDEARKNYWDSSWQYGRSVKKAYMTDFIQALIDADIDVRAIKINKGWLEFDTEKDYELSLKWFREGTLNRFFNL